MPLKQIQKIALSFYDAAADTINHDGIEHAGYLAFLMILALFPFLVLLVAVTGMLGEQDIGQEFTYLLLNSLPMNAAEALKPRIEEIVSGPPQGLLTVAILGAIWTASSIVEGIRTILNRAYRVHTPPAYWLRRLLSIAQLLIVTAIIIATMLGWVVVPIIYDYFQTSFGINFAFPIKLLSYGLTGFVLLLAIASIYYVLPNAQQRFVAILPGACIVILLWLGAAYSLSIYLSQFNQVNLIYGSLGGIIAALLFFYLISLILIFGAELNHRLEQAFWPENALTSKAATPKAKSEPKTAVTAKDETPKPTKPRPQSPTRKAPARRK